MKKNFTRTVFENAKQVDFGHYLALSGLLLSAIGIALGYYGAEGFEAKDEQGKDLIAKMVVASRNCTIEEHWED